MDPSCLQLVPSGTRTRLVLTQGPRRGARAVLPPLTHVRHGRAVTTLLESLALWLYAPVRVALCADASGTTSWLGLTDARGSGTRGLFHEVRLLAPRDKHQGGQVYALDDWEPGLAGGRP
jgi:hypothetical protein